MSIKMSISLGFDMKPYVLNRKEAPTAQVIFLLFNSFPIELKVFNIIYLYPFKSEMYF